MTRLLILAPEIVLSLAVVAALAALLTAGARAGRVAGYAVVGGTAGTIAAAILTRDSADAFLFAAYRIDPLSQLLKAVIGLGSLVAARGSGDDRWAAMRTTSPFFHLCATLALVMCCSIVSVLALPLAAWLAVTGTMLVAATVGRWSVLEKTVRRALASWLGMFALTLVGAIVLAAAGGVRLDHLVSAPRPPGLVTLLGLVLWCAAPLWMVAVGPVHLRRIEDDPSGSLAASGLARTALAAAGGLVLVRALWLALPGLPALLAAAALVLCSAPAFAFALRRFVRSFQHPAATAVAFGALGVAALLVWPWIMAAVGELD